MPATLGPAVLNFFMVHELRFVQWQAAILILTTAGAMRRT